MAFVAFAEEDGADAGCAQSWLAPAEAVFARRLPTVPRRAAWLAGRLAAKTAIARLEASSGPLDRIEILPASSGAPVVRHHAGHRVEVSIAHTRGLATAVAFDRCRTGALGIDLECCEQALDPALIDFAFSEAEAGALGALPDPGSRHVCALRFWTAKEAVLKAVGRGLRLPLSAVRLEWAGEPPVPDRASVRCGPDVAVAFSLEVVDCPGHVASLAIEGVHAG